MSSGTGSNYPAAVVAGESGGINQAFQPFPYPNTTQAANNAFSGIANDIPSGSISNLTGAGNNLLNMASTVPGYATQAGAAALGPAVGQYNTLAPYVTQALQTGFDPQNALYNQQFGLQQQQNLASEAMAGVGQSPYAAGLTAQGNNNFNIDWQNQQLARQAQAAQTGEGLSSAAMGALSGGINDYLSGLGLGVSSAEGLTGAAGNAYTQAAGINAQQVAQYLAYLNASTQNAAAASGEQIGALNAGTNLYGATNQANLAQQAQLGSALGGLGSLGGTLIGSNLGSIGSAFSGAGVGSLVDDAGIGASLGLGL